MPRTTLSNKKIDEVFETAGTQEGYIIGLHLAVLPNLDDVEKLEGYIQCSEDTWQYICEKAIEFDKLHHPNIMAGGCWLNYGFSGTSKLSGSRISLPRMRRRCPSPPEESAHGQGEHHPRRAEA